MRSECRSCGDWGIRLVVYTDGSRVYAVCLCEAGEQWRIAANHQRGAPPLWSLWAFQHGIDPLTVVMLEDAVTPEELAALGFRELTGGDAMGAIAAAARNRKTTR